jgi:hypothetical protein
VHQRVRGPWLQVGGLVVALGFIGAMGALGGCGAAGGSAGAPARTSGSAVAGASATPTADPREAALVAAAKSYVDAWFRAQVTGSATELHALMVPGSQADGLAGDPAHVVKGAHKTFVANSIQYTSVNVSALTTSANVAITYVAIGHLATWPQLAPTGSDQALKPNTDVVELQLEGGRWLIDAIH